MRTLEFDVIVIGAGSAGCVLANRLSARPELSVALLEAGPEDSGIWLKIPIGFSRTFNDSAVNWCFETAPQTALGGRQIFWPRGRVLGGSSSINGMIYVRGHPSDFDGWASMGLPGWSWADVLPYFQRSEGQACELPAVYGSSGPVRISSLPVSNLATDAFVRSAENSGIPRVASFNSDKQTGAGPYQITTSNGVRSSNSTAYLQPARHRQNLTVMTETQATRLCLTDGRVIGVDVVSAGENLHLRARKKVVVACGAVGSPALLQWSGIGNRSALHAAGIRMRAESPMVGKNLQDHYGVRYIARLTSRVSINDDFRRPWRLLRHLWQYGVRRTGQLAIGGAEAGAFVDSTGNDGQPDVQLHFLPLSSERGGWSFHKFSGVTANVCQLRPFSRGSVHVQDSDWRRPPVIDPGYLTDHRDTEVLVAGLRLTRRIFASEPMASLVAAEEAPGHDLSDDDSLSAFVRSNGSTVFHPVGTCAMGADSDSVLDERCRVRAVADLLVVDASSFPTLTSGNTNAAVTMLAEKISDDLVAELARSPSAWPVVPG